MAQAKPTGFRSPGEAHGIVAALTCMGCFLYLLAMAAPVVEWLHAWWAGWTIYVLTPLTLTFTLLHGSRIRREMPEGRRDTLLALMSLVFFVGGVVFITAAVMLFSVFMGIARVGP